MRQTSLFTKTRKEVPADEVAKNAQLLIRAGFIHKEMAGVYAFLPLGLRVVENIKQIVREEMNAVGGQELAMTTLQNKATWEITKRWDDEVVDVWFKSQLKNGTEVGFGWSHEEPITVMMQNYISSYRDLPICVYQFQNKLRNELRAKSGIMRGREFLMKDMYSYTLDEAAHSEYYEGVKAAYMKVFERVGLGADTYITFAAGGAFTEFSHEFQTVCEAGEDKIYLNREKGIAINEEVLSDKVLQDLNITRDELEVVTSAEVGNIFNFGTQKCDDMGLHAANEAGEKSSIYLGSYGIGITRLMGVLAEKFSDDKGLVWPQSVAPFAVHLISLKNNEAADVIYNQLTAAGIEVLYDDRDVSAGEKFADSDLIGIPYRVVTSARTGDQVEVKQRTEVEGALMNIADLLKQLQS
ncbi:MAG: prolyl-tRNA synthetase [Candidatus Buchananbacteria bacterium]|nr:prolyl-tRNA synthetase [Candidatus Buchananbacteria bacterium]